MVFTSPNHRARQPPIGSGGRTTNRDQTVLAESVLLLSKTPKLKGFPLTPQLQMRPSPFNLMPHPSSQTASLVSSPQQCVRVSLFAADECTALCSRTDGHFPMPIRISKAPIGFLVKYAGNVLMSANPLCGVQI